MIEVRRADERGHGQHGWLDTRHTFSFADYHDPEFMGFGPLRVINEDRVVPGRGFGTHGHRDMEIVTYVLDGALEHRDSLGTGSVIRPGDVQRMSAGTGVEHSEFNASESEPVHFLQIWIIPERTGIEPSYEQKRFDAIAEGGRLALVGSRDGRDGSVTIHQDVNLYAGRFNGEQTASVPIEEGRLVWVHVVRGAITVNGHPLGTGDAAALSAEMAVELSDGEQAEVLVFDMVS